MSPSLSQAWPATMPCGDPTARAIDPSTPEPLPWDPVPEAAKLDETPAPEGTVEAEDEPQRPEDPPDPRPPVYLSASGRRIVLAAWSQRLRTRLLDPALEARFELQELIRLQAQRFASACRDERDHTPFLWR